MNGYGLEVMNLNWEIVVGLVWDKNMDVSD